MIKFRFISLNSEGFLIQQKGPMVRFINYFSVVENMKKQKQFPGLQITVGHRTMSD